MLDIIVLIFLALHIGKVAARKGLKPVTWRIYTVLCWLGGEMLGVIIGLMFFGPDNLVSVLLVGIAGAVTGYFIIQKALDKYPDVIDDDINRIGSDDLRP